MRVCLRRMAGIWFGLTLVTAPARGAELVSVTSTGAAGNGTSSRPAISADGRFVAFESDASDLVDNDTNGSSDVFVRDLQSGTTTLVSRNLAGTGSANDASFGAVISADGRVVGFQSSASDLIATDTNEVLDIFARDLATGTTVCASLNADGSDTGDDFSLGPALSANGRYLAFYSNATNLVPNDTNGDRRDAFVRDLTSMTTTLVSASADGLGSGDLSSGDFALQPSISADGRYIAFESFADNLLLNFVDGNDFGVDVFVRDTVARQTVVASINANGTASGNQFSDGPVLSADGRVVAFTSRATDLVAGVSVNHGFVADVYARDLTAGTTALVSINAAGSATGNDESTAPVINANGRFVAFESVATDLVGNDQNGLRDVFVRDRELGTTTLVSVNAAGTGSGSGASAAPSLSANGRFVAFVSDADDLVPNDNNGTPDVFVRDLLAGTTTLVSVKHDGGAGGDAGSMTPMLSADGQFVAFDSAAGDLVDNDGNGTTDVFRAATGGPPACVGDCSYDDAVTVDEIIEGVNIALGLRPVVDCLPFDTSDDGTVTVEEIIAAVNAVLIGCPM